ncbi:MAG TPA: portal protein [Geminicoccaceae bacterium]|nr:portal protein [Geminicoccaceae bacterium]
MTGLSPEAIRRGFERARERRQPWESLWRECYAYALPQRGLGLGAEFAPARRYSDGLFDGTAPDAVEQLAASLLAELTPPWSQWFGFRPGHGVDGEDRAALAGYLEDMADRVRGHFERSSFAVEIHQCFLDLATVGTATLMFQEAPVGEPSAFRFCAVPAAEMYIDGDQNGQIRHYYRASSLTLAALRARYPDAKLPEWLIEEGERNPEQRHDVVEAVLQQTQGYGYGATLLHPARDGGRDCVLAEGQFDQPPFLTFRWMKGAGELYGRSPVMTALPDIKTANKVVELILKNASIAVTGIWLADDDGVLNPANIKLIPGSIIPKAVGSAGLTPLQAPGRFDVSQLVLDDLRARIRHTLLTDRLGPVANGKMTATEVLERSSEMTRLLGAMFGRLQSELLNPLVHRAVAILRRRGELPGFELEPAPSSYSRGHRSPGSRPARTSRTCCSGWTPSGASARKLRKCSTSPRRRAGWR